MKKVFIITLILLLGCLLIGCGNRSAASTASTHKESNSQSSEASVSGKMDEQKETQGAGSGSNTDIDLSAAQAVAEQIAELVSAGDFEGAAEVVSGYRPITSASDDGKRYTGQHELIPGLSDYYYERAVPFFVDTPHGRVGFYYFGVYVGDYEGNQRSGQGVFLYKGVSNAKKSAEKGRNGRAAGGDWYEGNWSNDSPNGEGTLTHHDGSLTFCSVGNFKDGRYDGTISFSVYDQGLNVEEQTYFSYLKYEYDMIYHDGTGEYLGRTGDGENSDFIVAENIRRRNQNGKLGDEGGEVTKSKYDMFNAGASDWD